jgi:hypothetical protein
MGEGEGRGEVLVVSLVCNKKRTFENERPVSIILHLRIGSGLTVYGINTVDYVNFIKA